MPYETTHEELCELAQPFGRLVQSKLNVGPNRNQAFIEFPDQATAVAMCNYFNGNADPAKVGFYLHHLNKAVKDSIDIAGILYQLCSMDYGKFLLKCSLTELGQCLIYHLGPWQELVSSLLINL